MKKIIPLLILLFTSSIASAQLFKGRNTTLDKPEYQIGAVTEVNGKVVFEENITAKGNAQEIMEKAQQWVNKRFAKPEIIKYKIL